MERKQKKEVIENMTEKEKKREMIENVAEKFLLLTESDKSFIAGYLAGKGEERAKWENREAVNA